MKEHEARKVLMMCRVVTVLNPETGRKCQVGMIIDNGSTDTYITKRLAENLKLKKGPIRDVEMVLLGTLNMLVMTFEVQLVESEFKPKLVH